MADEIAVVLLREIFDKTSTKKLLWQETASGGTFVAPMGGKYTVKLLPYTDNPFIKGQPPALQLFEGEELLIRVNDKNADAQALKDLYNLVVRIVHRIDEKNKSVADVISLLKNL